MRKFSLIVLASLATFALAAAQPAAAKGPGGAGWKSGGGSPPGFSHGRKLGWASAGPPGWSHGRKVGWHGGHMPPGLSKSK
jgi:hypothetical protein